jgi:hypothetical protein
VTNFALLPAHAVRDLVRSVFKLPPHTHTRAREGAGTLFEYLDHAYTRAAPNMGEGEPITRHELRIVGSGGGRLTDRYYVTLHPLKESGEAIMADVTREHPDRLLPPGGKCCKPCDAGGGKPPAANFEHALAKVARTEFAYHGRSTLCVFTLHSGFQIFGESHCQSATLYDKAKGCNFARQNALDKLLAFEAYLLAERSTPLME